jgi:hypothetical protein
MRKAIDTPEERAVVLDGEREVVGAGLRQAPNELSKLDASGGPQW